MSAPPADALLFDVFGTLTDWCGSIAREIEAVVGPMGVAVDGRAFALAWRDEYQPAMDPVRRGKRAYVNLDVLHAENLERILPRFGLAALPAETRALLVAAWHRLDAWPDVAPGLARLHRRLPVAPCSNGHVALMVALARRNGFVWDAILGADIARDFKPNPGVYLASCAALGLPPERVMMVACHSSDLAAAAATGLRTAFIARPDEKGPGGGESKPATPVDLIARDLLDLADQLGAA